MKYLLTITSFIIFAQAYGMDNKDNYSKEAEERNLIATADAFRVQEYHVELRSCKLVLGHMVRLIEEKRQFLQRIDNEPYKDLKNVRLNTIAQLVEQKNKAKEEMARIAMIEQSLVNIAYLETLDAQLKLSRILEHCKIDQDQSNNNNYNKTN